MRDATLSAFIAASALASASPAFAQTPPIHPGLWDTTSRIGSVRGPGAPPALTAMAGKVTHTTHCITPEAASRGPQALLKTLGPGCAFEHFKFSGARLDARMVCHRGDSTTTSTLAGTMTGDRYDGRIEAVTTGPRAMTLVTTYAGQRTGDCPSPAAGR